MELTIEALKAMDENAAIAATTGVVEHPEGYDGPCNCDLCHYYSADCADIDRSE